MFENLAVSRSAGARSLFLGSVAGTVAVLVLACELAGIKSASGLVPIFRMLFAVGDYQGAYCALLILLGAAAVSAAYSPRALLRWLGLHPLFVAVSSALLLSVGTWLVYQNTRLSMDEYAQYFQSQIFAAGHIAGQFPAPLLDWLIPRGFQNFFLNVSSRSGAVTSAYWPSFALLLAPFTWLGISWACNPIISALTLLVLHRLALRIFDDAEAAGLTLLLTIASPVFFADGISYYSMPAHLLANSLFALLLIDATPRRALLAGLVGSVALTIHNPVPHLLFAIPWIVSLLRQPSRRRAALQLFAGYLPLCLLLGLGWFFFSSHLVHEGVTATASTTGIADSLSKVLEIATLPSPSIWLARLIGVAKVWAWSVPGLLLLAVYGAWKWRRNRWCALLSASALTTLVLYVFVPVDQGHGWGYRYFHSAWLALPLLGAGALVQIPARVESRLADQGALAFMTVCALMTLIAGTGLRAVQMHEFIAQQERYLPQYSGTERQVVIIDPRFSFYGFDLVQNDPWLRGNTIRMITHGAEADAQMMSEYFAEMHRVYADKYGSVWSAR
jgi:hypothetical protein